MTHALDARGQRKAAAALAKEYDDPVEFHAVAVPKFELLGAAEVVEVYREAHGLDVRTGEKPRPNLQPSEVVDTAIGGTLAGQPVG